MGRLRVVDCLVEEAYRYHHSGLVAHQEGCYCLCYPAVSWQYSWRDNAG